MSDKLPPMFLAFMVRVDKRCFFGIPTSTSQAPIRGASPDGERVWPNDFLICRTVSLP